MPLCTSSLIVRLTLDMAGIILTAAGSAFWASAPSRRYRVKGDQYLLAQWWVATMPGIAIFVVSLGFNLLSDGLRDVLTPSRPAHDRVDRIQLPPQAMPVQVMPAPAAVRRVATTSPAWNGFLSVGAPANRSGRLPA